MLHNQRKVSTWAVRRAQFCERRRCRCICFGTSGGFLSSRCKTETETNKTPPHKNKMNPCSAQRHKTPQKINNFCCHQCCSHTVYPCSEVCCAERVPWCLHAGSCWSRRSCRELRPAFSAPPPSGCFLHWTVSDCWTPGVMSETRTSGHQPGEVDHWWQMHVTSKKWSLYVSQQELMDDF